MKAMVRQLEKMGYSVKSSGPGYHWVDGACGYRVTSGQTKELACRNALALISCERTRKGIGKATWYLPNARPHGGREKGLHETETR